MSIVTTPTMIGKNLTVQATPQDVSSVGVWTDNALGAVTFAGRLTPDGQSSEVTYATENVSPLDCGYSNPVDFEQSTSYNLSEFLQAATPATTANALDLISRTSKYVKLVFTWKDNASSPATVRTETAYVRWISFSPTYRKASCVGMLRMVTMAVSTAGVYIANPAVS